MLVNPTIVYALWTLASAASPAVQWDAPAPCPTTAQGLARIEANLGAALHTIETDANFTVVLSQGARGWSARIDMGSGATSSSRTLPAVDSCDEASDAAALVVAIALDPTAAAGPQDPATEPEPALIPEPEQPPQPEPDPEQPPPPEPEQPPPPETEPEQPPRAAPGKPPSTAPAPVDEPLALGGHLGLAGGVRYGSLDRLLGVLSLRGGLLLPRARVWVEAVVAPRRAVTLSDTAQVRFTQWALAAGGCWRVPLGSTVTLEPCGALELGQTVATTAGLDNARSQTPIWIALRAGPHLAWRFSRRVGLWTGVEALIPLNRSSFEVGGPGAIARTLSVGVHAFAGVEIRFGAPS